MRNMIEERGATRVERPTHNLDHPPSSAHTFVSTRPRGGSERRRNRLTTHILIHLAVRRGLLDCRMAKLGCSTQTTGILNSRMCMLRVQRTGAALCKLHERERHAPVGGSIQNGLTKLMQQEGSGSRKWGLRPFVLSARCNGSHSGFGEIYIAVYLQGPGPRASA